MENEALQRRREQVPRGAGRLSAIMYKGFAGAVQLWYMRAKDCIPPLGLIRLIINNPNRTPACYRDDDSALMWLSVQLEKEGWVPPFGEDLHGGEMPEGVFDNFVGAVLHFFPMEVQSEEAKANLEETQEPVSDDPNIARSKVFKTSGITQPIDCVAHRVAKQPHDAFDYRQVPCPKCSALAGEYCRTSSGKKSTNYHSARKQAHLDERKGATA